MTDNKVLQVVNAVGQSINKNSPSILIGLGIGGFVGTAVLAVQATPRAIALLEDEIYQKVENEVGDRTILQYFADNGISDMSGTTEWIKLLPADVIAETVAPLYAPSILLGLMSATAIIMANKIHIRRAAALASVYKIAEDSLKTYQEKVLATVGDKKMDIIQGEVAQAALDANPYSAEIVHGAGGPDSHLAYELATGRYFFSEVEEIKRTVNDFNHDLMQEHYKSLNDLYYDLGLPRVDLGDSIGWHIDGGLVEPIISAKVADENTPCLVLDFRPRPRYLWSD